jgi:hypothetical protein
MLLLLHAMRAIGTVLLLLAKDTGNDTAVLYVAATTSE